jgi:hypothetical protein
LSGSCCSARAPRRVWATRDGGDDQVDLGHGHAEALDQLALRLGLPQLEARAARDHVAAVVDEVHQASCAASAPSGCCPTMARQLIPEAALQRGHLVELLSTTSPWRRA